MKKTALLFIALLSVISGFGQTVKFRDTLIYRDTTITVSVHTKVPLSLGITKPQYDSLYTTFHPVVVSDAYDLTNALPAGYVTNGTVDYAAYLQMGLSIHTHVKLPNFPVLINAAVLPQLALTLQSNQTVDCPLLSLLIMKGNALTSNYGFFKLVGLSNVTINSPRMIGDLYSHLVPVTGGFGHSIMIYGCKNITINDAYITQSAGDGIYEARGGIGAVNSSNIILNHPICNFNGRNGISATGVDSLAIINPVTIGNTFNSPYCGIDLEPNTNLDDMNAITIINQVSRDNSPASNHTLGLGLSIGLKRLFYQDASQKVANLNKVVNITVTNISDCGSGVGFKVSQSILAGSTIKLSGQITVNNPTFYGEFSAANSVDIASTTLKFNLYNPTVYNAAGIQLIGQTALAFLMHNQTAGPNIVNSLSANPNP